MEQFTHELESEKPPNAVLTEVLSGLPGPLASAGYRLQTESERALTFARTYRPWFVWVGVVLLFPLGLLFLLYKETATISVVFEPKGGGTLIRVSGEGEAGVRRAFEGMEI